MHALSLIIDEQGLMASEVTSVVIGYRSWNTVEHGVSIFYFYII